MERMRPVRFTDRSVPLVFALVTIAAYGLMFPLIGFYWDDWPFAWIARFLGPSEFIPAFEGFRPFLGPIFFLTTSLLPATRSSGWASLYSSVQRRTGHPFTVGRCGPANAASARRWHSCFLSFRDQLAGWRSHVSKVDILVHACCHSA
jgi:hypothetical protein